MFRFMLGFVFGLVLAACAVATVTVNALRDNDGWELWTADETANLKDNLIGLLMQNMLLQRMLKNLGCI